MEVCERASSSEASAKEAVTALRREFKFVSSYLPILLVWLTSFCRYGEPPAQLSAARVSV